MSVFLESIHKKVKALKMPLYPSYKWHNTRKNTKMGHRRLFFTVFFPFGIQWDSLREKKTFFLATNFFSCKTHDSRNRLHHIGMPITKPGVLILFTLKWLSRTLVHIETFGYHSRNQGFGFISLFICGTKKQFCFRTESSNLSTLVNNPTVSPPGPRGWISRPVTRFESLCSRQRN